jgi:putative FmdB family regulatory protein
MPLYEYRCETCGVKEEKLEGFSAPTEQPCEHCGATLGMKRQISVTAFNLAGKGWYAEGYSNGQPGKAEGAASVPAPSAAPATPAPTPSGGCSGGCGCHPAKP